MIKANNFNLHSQPLPKNFLTNLFPNKQLKEKEGQKSATYGVIRGPSRVYTTNQASGSQSTKSFVTKASQTP